VNLSATFIGEICTAELTEVTPGEPAEHAIELMRYNAIELRARQHLAGPTHCAT
jgi:hypothetical protein